jgi:MYXO-CTERM domain-containing protein
MRLRTTLAAVALATWMVAPLTARAMTVLDLTLGDLVGGTPESFQSEDGTLTFSSFGVVVTGSLATFDLDTVQILLTESGFGFSMVAGLSANDGEIGDMLVTFDVSSLLPIVSASLSFNGAASGVGAGASVVETFQGINDQAFVFVTGGGGGRSEDTVEFQAPAQLDLTALRVTKDIILDSTLLAGGTGGEAVISIISQDFAVVPEPSAALLGLLGLGALFLVRRLHG